MAALALAGLLSACEHDSPDLGGAPPTPAPTAPSVPTPTPASTPELRLSARSGTATPVAVRNAFPNLAFDIPVDLALVPPGESVAVVEHRGRIRAFDNDPAAGASHVMLDITDRVLFDEAERGLISLAFAPDFATSGQAYVTYAAGPARDPDLCDDHCSVVSRFTRASEPPLSLDPNSEEIILILPQPGVFHNIGQLSFGPDGYLYIAAGDGFSYTGSGFSQDRTNLYGSILRLDVAGELPYRIPPDNPFVGAGLEREGVVGAGQPVREEIWAFGLRNPHYFSFDRSSGELWLGDVGQYRREEINRIEPGANYGWPVFEGSARYEFSDTTFGRELSDFASPHLDYGREDGRSVTGGVVYRGGRLPGLFGRYLFGDFISGTLWSVPRTADNGAVEKQLVTEDVGAFGMVAFAQIDNEVYIANFSQGIIQTLDAGTDCDGEDCQPLPERLSETGIFSSLTPLTASPRFFPYEVAAPLWSDGTIKQRWFTLPPGETVDFDPGDGAWHFPAGSVLVKDFALSTGDDPTASLRHLETRILLRRENDWLGFVYLWDDDQQDAALLTGPATLELGPHPDDDDTVLHYDVPSRADCATCHNGSTGFALGLRTGQINRLAADGADPPNQLDRMRTAGLLDPAPPPSESLPAYPDPALASADLNDRARAYLAANCAHCHNPAINARVSLDLRFSTAPENMNIIDETPRTDDFDVEGAKLVAPGDASRSLLWLRMQTRDNRQMPPLATKRSDPEGLALIREWIEAMPQAGGDS